MAGGLVVGDRESVPWTRHVARVTTADTLCQGHAVTIYPRVDGDPGPHPLDLERDMMTTRPSTGPALRRGTRHE
jgi:hypothetical protein